MKMNLFVITALIYTGGLLFSCKSPEPKPTPEPGPVIASIKGDFYHVQCSKVDFDKLSVPSQGSGDPRGNVVFKYFVQDGKFTLKGWAIKGASSNNWDFDSLPNIGFAPTTVISSVTYGDQSSFGDFVLSKKNVLKIQAALESRDHFFVVFVPKILTDGTVAWSAGTSETELLNFQQKVEPVEDCELDPIPPRRYDR